MNKMMKRLISVVALGLTVAACKATKPKPRDEVVPVTVAVAAQKNVPLQLRAIGRVTPLQTVEVHALVTGQLQNVWFREGQDVQRGDRLFTIDPRPYQAELAQAQANLARDEANMRNAEAEAARYSELVKKDYVTREEHGRYMAAAAAARATVASNRAAVENARLNLSYCDIRAPMSGRTGSLQVHAGNIVKANDPQPLVVINQIRPVYVQFAVPENQLTQLRTRAASNVPVAAMSQQGNMPIATGSLSFINNEVDAATGTITLKATFANQDSALWPGQFVTVAVNLQDRPNAVVVPSQAVQTGQRGQYVYVVKQDRSGEMRTVKAGDGTAEQETIIEAGLQPGETIITDGQLRLTPKSKVDVKNGR